MDSQPSKKQEEQEACNYVLFQKALKAIGEMLKDISLSEETGNQMEPKISFQHSQKTCLLKLNTIQVKWKFV